MIDDMLGMLDDLEAFGPLYHRYQAFKVRYRLRALVRDEASIAALADAQLLHEELKGTTDERQRGQGTTTGSRVRGGSSLDR